jgi:LysM repeat protein
VTDVYGISLRQPQPWDVVGSISIIVVGGMQGYQLHQVVRGDTVSAIARAAGSTVAKIAAASRLHDPNRIQVGQVLRVPL